MAKNKKQKETPQMRLERLALSKCMMTKKVKDKKKYDKKRERQKKFLPSFLVHSLISSYIVLGRSINHRVNTISKKFGAFSNLQL